jgi:hypothetical protein
VRFSRKVQGGSGAPVPEAKTGVAVLLLQRVVGRAIPYEGRRVTRANHLARLLERVYPSEVFSQAMARGPQREQKARFMGQLWDAEPNAIVANDLKEASQPFEWKWNIVEEGEPPRNGPEQIKNRLAAVEFCLNLQALSLVAGAGFEPATFRL